MTRRTDSGSGDGGSISIETALTGGDLRTLQNAELVIELARRSTHRLEELFDCVFSDDEVVRMRASDALEKVCRERPDLLRPHIERLLTDMAAVEQPSVQWHLAQILAAVPLNDEERRRAIAILRRNLAEYDNWIVVNSTLQSLADLAHDDPSLRTDVVEQLHRQTKSRYKSVTSRVRRLLRELGE